MAAIFIFKSSNVITKIIISLIIVFSDKIEVDIIENIKLNTLSTKTFELDNTFTNIEYFNLLGQKVKEPKGVVIVKAKKNGIVYTKKSYF